MKQFEKKMNGQFLDILSLYVYLHVPTCFGLCWMVFCTGLFWCRHPRMSNLLPDRATNATNANFSNKLLKSAKSQPVKKCCPIRKFLYYNFEFRALSHNMDIIIFSPCPTCYRSKSSNIISSLVLSLFWLINLELLLQWPGCLLIWRSTEFPSFTLKFQYSPCNVMFNTQSDHYTLSWSCNLHMHWHTMMIPAF